MQQHNIKLERRSIDSKENNHRYKIIDLCKSNNLVIVNGRTDADIPVKITFQSVLVIDYFLASVKDYCLIYTFHVQELDSLFSDGHSILECEIKIYFNFEKEVKTTRTALHRK